MINQTRSHNLTVDFQGSQIQHTLGAAFELSGVGLHSGLTTQVRVLPAEVGQGRYFVRQDLPTAPIIPARIDAVVSTTLSTELGTGDKAATVRTVEHLLAALAAMGVDNARIEIDGPEVPLLDGSALVWVEAIASVGVVPQLPDKGDEEDIFSSSQSTVVGAGLVVNSNLQPTTSIQNPPLQKSPIPIQNPIWIYHKDAFVAALPAPEVRFTYGIDFDLAAIGNQWHSWSPAQQSFATEIAPARTFGLAHQIDQLRAAGLIKGGSLDNALVCSAEGWINPPLRFANEPARHKLLDLVGDLSLLGKFPQAHFLAYKASHQMHVQLAQMLAKEHFGI